MTQSVIADGRYLEEGGRPAVQFVRTYAHAIERIWHTITDADESEHWFPSRVELEPREGGSIHFRARQSGRPDYSGVVLAFDEPKLLAFTWGEDEVRIELEALAPESTRFTLTNFLSERNGAARNGAGWETCLVGLERLLAGSPDAPPHLDAYWDARYERYIAAGFPVGAKVHGREE